MRISWVSVLTVFLWRKLDLLGALRQRRSCETRAHRKEVSDNIFSGVMVLSTALCVFALPSRPMAPLSRPTSLSSPEKTDP